MLTLTFDWGDDGESFVVYLSGEQLIDANHGEHGWAGMMAIHNAFVKAAQVAGWSIHDAGEPCF